MNTVKIIVQTVLLSNKFNRHSIGIQMKIVYDIYVIMFRLLNIYFFRAILKDR